MKIKKCLMAATLSVGLACSTAALAPAADVSPTARIGFIIAHAATRKTSELTRDVAIVAVSGGGAVAISMGTVWVGTKIGTSFGAMVAGPVGAIAGAVAGAV